MNRINRYIVGCKLPIKELVGKAFTELIDT